MEKLMYPSTRSSKSKALNTLAFLILLSLNGFSQLLQWNTFGNVGTETSEPSIFNDPNIISSSLTLGSITAASNTNRFGGSAWFNTGNTAAGNTLSEAVTGNDYIQFIVTPNSGFTFTPTSLVFQWDRSGTGPFKLTLRSSVDGFVSDLGTINPVAAIGTSNTINITGLSGLSTATTFRLYGYGATGTGGTGGFDVSSNIINVQLNGSTSSSTTPNITLSLTTLSSFTYIAGAGPSPEQTFTCSGSNLSGTISLSAPADYEISTTSGSGFGTSINLTPASGTVSPTIIYVRLKAGLVPGTYNSQIITASSAGASNQTVTCNGSVTASASTDIITFNGESATISSTENTASPLTSSTGVQVWQFKIRDGGAGLNDADNLSSILNSFTISQAAGNSVANWSTAIKTIELFDGTTNIATGTVSTGPNQISFSGLNINVADNTEKTLSIRLSLNCGIGPTNSDGDDFGFQISNGNVSFSASGSGKAAFGATTSTNGQNVLSVVATQLQFTQQPSTSGMNGIMTPAVVVKATDACGNTDIAFTSTITVTSTGTMVGSPVSATATAGVATFSTITHTAAGTGFTLTASSGTFSVVSNTFDIVATTVLGGGDLAIVGICVNIDACNGTSSGTDEISFVTFEDITPGTAIDITDNGFERVGCGSNNWGNGEGVIRLTRNTSVIAKGTIITFRVVNNTYFSAVSPDANWTISYPVGSSFNLNSNDEQVYMMQGGTWNAGTAGSSNATYTGGTFMFAINTYTAWTCNDNLTTRGGLPDALKCFSIMPSTGTVNVKYTGSVTPASQKDWIDRLNSISNWSASTTCTAYNALSPNYAGGYSFSIVTGGFNSGYWTGATSTDWYDCNNWQNFKVPDSLANVTIDNVTNDPVIGASPVTYPNGAVCNDMLITSVSGSGVLTLNNPLSYLSIKGNVTNNGIITASNGLTDLRSSNSQTISGTGTTSFYNLRLNNTHASGVNLLMDVTATNSLTFTNGMLSTGSNKFIITNTVVPTIFGYTSSKFINGKLRHHIGSNTSTYAFPIGDGPTSGDYKRADLINNNLNGVSYVDAFVNSINEIAPEDDATFAAAGQTQNGSALSYIMENAQWDLTPDAQPSGNTYGVRLYTANTGLSSAEDNNFFVVKRPSSSVSYADWVSLDGSTTIPSTGSPGRIYDSGIGYAERNGYSSFSKFSIATSLAPLPIELLDFTAKYNGKDAVNLSWVTASETNNDYFTIERSSDGIFFTEIGNIDGAGTSLQSISYSSIDQNPLKGQSYYRLKQTDFNGDHSYSNIVSVNINSGITTLVYPNPAISELNIHVKDQKGETLLVEVISTHGGSVKKQILKKAQDSLYKLNVEDLAPGSYILRTTFGTETQQILFLKE